MGGKKNFLPFIIFILSFSIFSFFKPPFIINVTDEFDYLTSSILLKKSPLFLGRLAFILFYHFLYKLASFFINIPPLKAYIFFKTITLILSSLALSLWYLFLEKIFKNIYLALAGTIFLFANYTLISYSSAVMTDMPGLFILVLSLMLLKFGHDQKNWRLVLASAIALGLGFNVREQILYFLPWTVVFLKKIRQLNPKIFGFYLVFLTITAAAFPLFLYLTEGPSYFEGISKYFRHNLTYLSSVSFGAKMNVFVHHLSPTVFIFFLTGLFCLARSQPIKTILFLLPVVLTLNAPIPVARIYLPLWLLISPLAALGCFQIIGYLLSSKKSKKRFQGPIFIFFALLFVLHHLLLFTQHLLPRDTKNSLSYLDYQNELLEKIPSGKAVFLVGGKTWLIGNYLQVLVRPKWEVIPSGWSWPGQEKTIRQIKSELAQKTLVLIDPGAYEDWEKEEINLVIQNFDLKPYTNSLFQITGEKDRKQGL